jgi:AcrR family transcriptional regulator
VIEIARGFSEERKEAIRTLLIKEGKRLFGKYGLKKTNIVQLTEAAGISPAAFYKFFESKEQLYFLIFEEEALKTQALILKKIMNSISESMYSNIYDALITISNLYKEDPFMEQVFLGNDLSQLLPAISKDEIDAHVLTGYKNFTPAFKDLQKEGKIVSVEPRILITVMQLFYLLNEQRSSFDSGVFDQAMNLLAGWIASGFTNVVKEN